MRLKTLGGLALEPSDFSRPKPLLLLAYLAVEGTKEKRHLYELFWPEASDPANSLRVLIKLLREVSLEFLSVDERTVSTQLESDFAALQEAFVQQDAHKVAELYQGGFLAEFSLPDWGSELEEWVYSTREFVASRVRADFIRAAEAEATKGAFDIAAHWAEKAYWLGRQDPEPQDLERLYGLLVAGDYAASTEVKKQAKEYGLELSLSRAEAQRRYYVAPAESSVTPPTKATSHNLPRAKTSFIGRDPELVELGQIISQGEIPLITLLGPGGMGKTRLALQLARGQLQENNFPDGIYFVALEALEEPTQISLALAQTLGAKVKDDPFEAVKVGIGQKRMLLVLDNFEHLVEGALMVSELLEACRHLSIIVTSRERLNLEEEYAFGLEGLPLPKESNLELSQVELNDAVKLFVQRAKRARLDFALTPQTLPHVLEICQFVEGSPLGIELAAVWLRSLPIAEVAREIGKIIAGLEAPSRNLGERHQSLRAVFEHSWKLLKPKEQITLAKLTVFIDGFTREAAGQVADATIPLLTSLVDKSLLRVSPEGRYDFHPLLYQYAGEKLAGLPEEKEQTKAKHGQYFLALVEASSKAVENQIKCCQDEYENLLKALAWSQESNQALLGLRLGYGLALFWETQGFYAEGIQWLSSVLSHPDGTAPSEERAKVLLEAADLASSQAKYALAQTYLEEALDIAQTLSLQEHAASAFMVLSMVAGQRGHPDKAQSYAEEALSLARKLNDDELVAHTLVYLASAVAGSDTQKAQTLTKESIGLYRKLGLRFHVALKLNNVGFWAWLTGDLQAAKNHLEESIAIAEALPDLQTVCLATSNLGGVMQDLGDLRAAQTLARKALEFRWERMDKFGLAHSLENLAALATTQGTAQQATHLWGAAQKLRQEIGTPMSSLWQARQERFIAIAKSQLDAAGFGFETALQEGQALGLEEAVKLARGLEFTEPMGVATPVTVARGR